jgi:Fibronectin type III domain
MPCSFLGYVDHQPTSHQRKPRGINTTRLVSLEEPMNDLIGRRGFLLWIRVAETAHISRQLTTVITGLLLSIMPLITGCGGAGEAGNNGAVSTPPIATSASLAWDPVTDPSVSAYFVHYGQQSPSQAGSCTYERSMIVDSSSATVTDLDPNTLYYFAVSAYNGLESACSNEVSLLTAPPPSTAVASEESTRAVFRTGSL